MSRRAANARPGVVGTHTRKAPLRPPAARPWATSSARWQQARLHPCSLPSSRKAVDPVLGEFLYRLLYWNVDDALLLVDPIIRVEPLVFVRPELCEIFRWIGLQPWLRRLDSHCAAHIRRRCRKRGDHDQR